jgi:arsenate reductase
MTAHWGVPDPAAVEGSDDEKRQAFRAAYITLDSRIKLLISLPAEKLDRLALQRELDRIGKSDPVATCRAPRLRGAWSPKLSARCCC